MTHENVVVTERQVPGIVQPALERPSPTPTAPAAEPQLGDKPAALRPGGTPGRDTLTPARQPGPGRTPPRGGPALAFVDPPRDIPLTFMAPHAPEGPVVTEGPESPAPAPASEEPAERKAPVFSPEAGSVPVVLGPRETSANQERGRDIHVQDTVENEQAATRVTPMASMNEAISSTTTRHGEPSEASPVAQALPDRTAARIDVSAGDQRSGVAVFSGTDILSRGSAKPGQQAPDTRAASPHEELLFKDPDPRSRGEETEKKAAPAEPPQRPNSDAGPKETQAIAADKTIAREGNDPQGTGDTPRAENPGAQADQPEEGSDDRALTPGGPPRDGDPPTTLGGPDGEGREALIDRIMAEDRTALLRWQNEHKGVPSVTMPGEALRGLIPRRVFELADDPQAIDVRLQSGEKSEGGNIGFFVIERLEREGKEGMELLAETQKEFSESVDNGDLATKDRVLYYLNMGRVGPSDNADLFINLLHVGPKRKKIATGVYEELRKFAREQNFKFIVGSNEINRPDDDTPSINEIYTQHFGRKKAVDLGHLQGRFAERYRKRGINKIERLTVEELFPHIELVTNPTVDTIVDALAEEDPDWEYLDPIAFAMLVNSPIIDEDTFRGGIVEKDIIHRLERIANKEEFQNLIILEPITQAHIEGYTLRSRGKNLVVTESKNNSEVAEYDFFCETIDPTTGEATPTVVEVRTRVGTKSRTRLRARSIMHQEVMDERLRGLKEFYGSNRFAFVLVTQPELLQDDIDEGDDAAEAPEHPPKVQNYLERNGKIVLMQINMEELEAHLAGARAKFDQIDPARDAQPDPVIVNAEASGRTVEEVIQSFGDRIRRGEAPTVLPSLNEFALKEGLSRSAARIVYETLKRARVARFENDQMVIDRAHADTELSFVWRAPNTGIERMIPQFLDANLHEGELLTKEDWMLRLNTSKNIISAVFDRLVAEGYITRAGKAAFYFGTNRDTFHRRYIPGALKRAQAYLRIVGIDVPTEDVVRRLGVPADRVERAKNQLREQQRREIIRRERIQRERQAEGTEQEDQ